jgi:N-acetyl sugar amidotransferase
MDNSDPKIVFDDNGECNHCKAYEEANIVFDRERDDFYSCIRRMKRRSSKYDCIVGVSGGLDSTYLLIHAVQDLGLTPLAVHVDNGWNTGEANTNIYNLCSKLNVDLKTIVLDWEEFRRMQIAMLASGTPDLEAPTDLFINYSLREIARKENISYILSGTNPQTEAVMGSTWSYGQRDPIYLKGLFLKEWSRKPRKLPFKNWYLAMLQYVSGRMTIVRPLKFVEYDTASAIERCKEEIGWISYKKKHGESFITRFYQNYFLPVRFGYDKTRAHLSARILNGELSREEALMQLNAAPDITRKLKTQSDIDFFCTKLRITNEDFSTYMSLEKRFYDSYETMHKTNIFRAARVIKNANWIPARLKKWMSDVISF